MKLCVLFLTTVVCAALVWSAPLEKSDENEIELAKRAKETIMFGNQQNAPRVKKRDPEDATGDSDVPDFDDVNEVENIEDNSNLDLKGQVVAMPARETEESNMESGANDSEQTDQDVIEEIEEPAQSEAPEDIQPSQDGTDPDIKDMIEAAEKEVDIQEQPEDNQEQPEDETSLIPVPSNQNPEDISDFYKYLMRYENLLKEAPYSRVLQQYPQSYYSYRKRRSILRKLGSDKLNSNKAVKRAKRIKRDLFDDEAAEYYYPYVPEPEVMEEPGYGEMDVYPENKADVDEGDLLAYLLSLYDNEEVEEPTYEVENPYERLLEAEEEQAEEEAEEARVEEEPVYVPVKRQMLSNLPGMRKRYFYPFNKEPQTHWGAFVPQQKRDYYNAYDRVLRVARALAKQDDYYPEMYDGYKK